MMENILTVTRLNYYIKNIIEEDPKLTNIVVKGEISNLNKHYTGHYYFTLKDENSKISCMMFSSYVNRIKIDIKNGDEVILYGYVSCFEKNGTYQLYVKNIEPFGLGQYLLKLEALKKKLKEEGLFDKEKKIINRTPKSIGIITSQSGAAVKDLIHTITSRWDCDIYIFPCQVQGEEAHHTIVKRIKQADSFHLDTLILGRGGGSIDDLKCFNEEDVVRAVHGCNTPIITAVGHEIDKTLVDYVSDFASITPTDAGEKATLNKKDILLYLDDLQSKLTSIMNSLIDEKRNKLMLILSSKSLISPVEYFSTSLKRVGELNKKGLDLIKLKIENLSNELYSKDLILKPLMENKITRLSLLLRGNNMKLEALNPTTYLDKGYSLIALSNNKILTSIDDVAIGEQITIQIKDGLIDASVIKKRRK
ncbi:MAG: exodeoxyribonuclease VII large subunit [Bacilli bacterium]